MGTIDCSGMDLVANIGCRAGAGTSAGEKSKPDNKSMLDLGKTAGCTVADCDDSCAVGLLIAVCCWSWGC